MNPNPVGLINSSKVYDKNDNYNHKYNKANSYYDYEYDKLLSNVCYINSSIQCLMLISLKEFH